MADRYPFKTYSAEDWAYFALGEKKPSPKPAPVIPLKPAPKPPSEPTERQRIAAEARRLDRELRKHGSLGDRLAAALEDKLDMYIIEPPPPKGAA